MPCLNEADSLAQAVESAGIALNLSREQGLSGEIVVSDNGSLTRNFCLPPPMPPVYHDAA